jgi:hypothetical protein
MAISSKYTIAVILTCISSTLAFCQTDALVLSSGVVSPGGTASLSLSLTSPTGSEPAALEWTLIYSPSAIVGITASPGSAATAANKSLACTAGAHSYTCFLTGLSTSGLDANIIKNGQVAVVMVTISPSTTATSIGITNALGALPSGSAAPITATGGTITTVAALSPTLLTCNPTTILSGASSTCTASLNQPAPTGGTIVALSGNNALLTLPASVTVAAGASSATFAATAGTLITTRSATLTATLNGASYTAALTLMGPMLISALACNSTDLEAGVSSTCTLTLSAPAPAGGVAVSVSANSSTLTVPASVNVPAGLATASFTATAPTAPPDGESTRTVLVTAALNGSSQSESFTLIICPCSLWPSTAQPVNPASTNKRAIEVGMLFTSSISGFVTGVRFFKASTNEGTHLGNLWASNGTHLSQVTFTDETASGWQVAYFPSPVAIAANTRYVISYHAPQGHNAADNGSFTTSVSHLPLLALADGQDGPNSVYNFGSSEFPTTGSSATNYWVDVILNTSATIGTAPPVSIWAPTTVPETSAVPSSQAAELGLTFMSEVPGYITGLRFYKSSKNLGTHIGYLWTATGTLLASVAFTNESASGWQQANFSAPIAIDANAPYVISYWSPRGHYADDAGYFATSGVTNQMLYAPPNGQYGLNGPYATSDVFPAGSSNSSNYWTDVVFTTAIQ